LTKEVELWYKVIELGVRIFSLPKNVFWVRGFKKQHLLVKDNKFTKALFGGV